MPSKHKSAHGTRYINNLALRYSGDLNVKDIILACRQENTNNNIQARDNIQEILMHLPREFKIKYFSRRYKYSDTNFISYHIFHYVIIGLLNDKYVCCTSYMPADRNSNPIVLKEFKRECQINEYFGGLDCSLNKCINMKTLCGEKKHCFSMIIKSFLPKVIISIVDDYVFWFYECIYFAYYTGPIKYHSGYINWIQSHDRRTDKLSFDWV